VNLDGPELVYAVPRDVLFGDVAPWLGVQRDGMEGVLDRAKSSGKYVPRSAAETDGSLKQIIPYLVLRDGERIFLMKRTRAGGDPRLHDHYTIGVGGHLNPGDGWVVGGLAREWQEEIDADFIPDFEFFGLLNDDTVEVGRHHLGFVYLADAAGRTLGIRETDKLSGSFEGMPAVRAVYDMMETWSQLVLDAIVGSAPASRPLAHAVDRDIPE
jgi:predicted NUDIX family phosphoesterase